MSAIALYDASLTLSGRLALDGVSLSVAAGELVAVVGPNGAGKSTALRACLGLIALDQGRAELGGDDVRRLSARTQAERAAYLPQDRRIAWNMPAVEVAALGAPWLAGSEARGRAVESLEAVGAVHLADRGVGEMSGGERARVLLARALTAQATALIADEPIADLDPDAQLLVLDLLRQRARAGRAVVASLHDLTLAARHADRIIVLDRGCVAADSAPLTALTPEILLSVFGIEGAWIETPDGPLLSARRA
ncbi:MAG: ABC transporter ATP-binding protein [Brevundimonas sp.]|uniref:ABC transporter ATP-binding protein n=1 Tax=Brevundimonas sp. TaxID=1871086 RepID=UPI001222C64D|nr:ABC transporter ATP-binding protein [Brevundimonas sp.]RZJ17840.1 MAG: ABC transporter ATP-binding protein [Brevundimonas sp.]